MAEGFTVISETGCFGGLQGTYEHESAACGCTMRFAVFTPPQAAFEKVPVLWFLAGLTCTEENATVKAGFQRIAAELGLMIVCPDTSPRGDHVPDDADSWDFAKGAGFYLDATQAPWAENYNMESWVSREMQIVIGEPFNSDMERQGITGHSMGGHGALTLALKNPTIYKSVSAFAPIVSPTRCQWGEKAMTGYLGSNRASWAHYDACLLLDSKGSHPGTILIDQGLADPFLKEQLKPELFEEACKKAGQKLTYRAHENYDHGYFFISTFIEDHLRHHAGVLIGNPG